MPIDVTPSLLRLLAVAMTLDPVSITLAALLVSACIVAACSGSREVR